MTSETGQLQRLSDAQVSARLDHYRNGGEFEKSLHWLWDQAGEALEEACRRHFGEEGAKVVRAYMSRPVDAAWVHTVAKHGRLMFVNGGSVPEFIAARARMVKDVLAGFEQQFAGRTEDRQLATDVFHRMMSFSQDIILAQIALLEAPDSNVTLRTLERVAAAMNLRLDVELRDATAAA